MRRKFSEVLSSWKNKEVHLPLLVQGARQIGKTYSLKQFGQDCFVKTIYINFETDRYLAGYWEQKLRFQLWYFGDGLDITQLFTLLEFKVSQRNCMRLLQLMVHAVSVRGGSPKLLPAKNMDIIL